MATMNGARSTNGTQRQDTWHRMQRMEPQEKISRMTAPPLSCSRTRTASFDRSPSSNSMDVSPEREPAPSMPPQSSRRSIQTSNSPPEPASQLAIIIPPRSEQQSKISTSEGSTTIVVNDEAASEVSSICHSPSWSDYKVTMENEKKKAKARKELEKQKKKEDKERMKAEKQAGSGASKPKRLSKTGPPSSRPGMFRRSATAPAVPGVDNLPKPMSCRTSADVPTLKGLGGESSPARKRQSVDLSKSRTSFSSDSGFVGGLKLRMMEDGTVQDIIAEQKQKQGNRFPIQGSATPRQYLDLKQRASLVRPQVSTQYESDATTASSKSSNSNGQEIIHPTRNGGSITEPPLSREDSEGDEVDLAKHAGQGHNSEWYPDAVVYKSDVGSNEVKLSSTKLSAPGRSFDEMSFTSSIAPAPERSNDTATRSKFQEEITSSPIADEFSNFVFTNPPGDNNNTDYDDEDNYHSFVTESYTAPELVIGPNGNQKRPSLMKRTNSSTNPMFAGLKKAARSAFSRNSTSSIMTVTSLSKPCSVRPASVASFNTVASKPRASMSTRDGSKADRILGEILHEEHPGASTSGSMSSASASNTDPSEGRSSAEVTTSNITTPTASRPHSRQPTLSRLEIDHDKPGSTKSSKLSTRKSKSSVPEGPIELLMEEEITLVRSKSIGKSHSTSQLDSTVADLSFLPELKHQPLTRPAPRTAATDSLLLSSKRKAKGKEREAVIATSEKSIQADSLDGNPTSSTYLRDARLSIPRSAPHSPKMLHAQPKQRRMSIGTSSNTRSATPPHDQPIAKMFVICCSCKFFHDLPSKVYEAMARGPSIVQDMDLGISGIIKTQVSCPWCNHGMSTDCCAGYSTVLYLRERFH